MKFVRQVQLVLSLMLLVIGSASAQNRVRVINASLTSDQSLVRKTTDPTYIPGGSRVYVANINGLPGFETIWSRPSRRSGLI